MVQIGQHCRLATVEGQRRVTLQRRVSAGRVVVRVELRKLTFQITRTPEQHMVEEFAPHRADQALNERV
jgi:hypothetical protein